MELANRVAETTTTTGYASLVLRGATFGHRSFRDSGLTSFPYCIVHQSEDQWEIGEGSLTPGGLLSRDVIIDSSISTVTPEAVNLLPGTKDIFITVPVGFGVTSTVTVGSATLIFVSGILTEVIGSA